MLKLNQIKNNLKNGYVLILSLMIIGVSMALLTTVYNSFFVYQDSIKIFIQKEQAKLLAQSGIEIALAKVSMALEKPNLNKKANNQNQNKTKEMPPDQKWLAQVLPILNQWQSFSFKDKDFEGTIQIYISAENGKINLNQFMNIEKTKTKEIKEVKEQKEQENKDKSKENKENQKSIKEAKKEKAESVLSGFLKDKLKVNISQKVKSTVQNLNRALIDPTEIISEQTKQISSNLFISPKITNKNNYEFMDLFTVFTESFKLNPWVLSKSTSTILGFKPLVDKESKDKIKEIIKNFKPKLNLEKDFDSIFKKVYGKDFKSLGKLKEAFMTEFEVDSLSVVCYAQVENIEAAIYAILEKEGDSKDYSKNSYIFNIKRIYWI